MAKLIVLSLAFAALVVFSAAHTTIFTTTTTIENPFSKQQCRRQIQGEQFDECQIYLQQDESSMRHQQEQQQQQQGIRMCCQELQRIDDECVCDAVTQIFGEAQQQQQRQQAGRQGQHIGAQQIQRLKRKAQNIPNICKIQTERCQIRTMITNTIDDMSSQGCRQIVQRQPFNQCKSFIAQQIRSPRTILMSVTKQGQEQECCDEIQNVNEECQCEAMKEVYNKVIQQQESGRQYGGEKQQMRQQVRHIIQMLPSQCGLDVQQCRIPSEMF